VLFVNAVKIPELRAAKGGGGSAIQVGAAVSINRLIEMLKPAASAGADDSGASSHAVLAKHLGKVANNQVRNVGSWAGNLAMCHAHPEFQSDIATIMMAAGAAVTIADAKGTVTRHTLSELFSMTDFVALVSLEIPANKPGLLRTYKVMRRHQNAHAVVNAGFDIKATGTGEDATLVVASTPTLVWGGLSPHPTRAAKTEALLVGKDLATQATLKLALSSLEAEFSSITGTDVAFRKSLISSLFYKYWVEMMTLHKLTIPANQVSAGVPYERPASTSTESHTAGVCDAIPKLASHRQAAGEAVYSCDNTPGATAMFASYVPATVSNGEITSIDASEALKMEGVIDVIDASHFGPANDTPPVMTPENKELAGRKVLAEAGPDKPGVRFFGQAVAIVLADSEEHADYAAKHGVAVEYSGEKKPVVSIDQAIAAGGEYLTHDAMDRETKKMTPMGTQRGDVAAAEAKAAHTAEGVVYASG